MQRVVASFLIALVGLMALIPQALCPCAQRGRAEAAQAREAGRPVEAQACCPLCAQRQLPQRAAVALASGVVRPPEAPPVCPCCEVNGGGKYLLQLGGVIRPEPAAPLSLLAALPVSPALDVLPRACAQACVGDHEPDEAPPAERRAGVVLLI